MTEVAHRHLTRSRAIATHYQGAHFRSRLEARWAAFFDLCAWRWEYEPVEEGGWIPDFLLIGANRVLRVEVKPINWFGHYQLNLLAQCQSYPGLVSKLSPHVENHGEVLVLGAYPFAYLDVEDDLAAALGVFLNPYTKLATFMGKKEDEIDFSMRGEWTLRMHRGDAKFLFEPDTIDRLWRQAGAKVQWRRSA